MELVISNLTKTYPNGVQALKNVTLRIPTGMFGLLGPNGAGKSTLMRIIATLQEPDSGTITWDGVDILKDKDKVRRTLGYLPQEFGLDPKVTAEDMLDHIAALKGIKPKQRREAVKSLLAYTKLYDVRKHRLGSFSGGMKQRFGIAQALLGNPQLIIVDEPTAGLDPEERVRFHNLLSEIGENIIVILSTHIVDDARVLCQTFAVINLGEVLLYDIPARALNNLAGKVWRKLATKAEAETIGLEHNVLSTKLSAGNIIVHILADSQPLPEAQVIEPDLEDVYFAAIKYRAPSPSAAGA